MRSDEINIVWRHSSKESESRSNEERMIVVRMVAYRGKAIRQGYEKEKRGTLLGSDLVDKICIAVIKLMARDR